MTTDKKNILLVEDDAFLRKMYHAKLVREGFFVTTAINGEEGYTALFQERPDLILLDIMMPKINGFDFLEAMRSNDELSDIKVIIMSNLSQKEDIAKGEQLGVLEYFTKSDMQIYEVIDRIRHHLDF